MLSSDERPLDFTRELAAESVQRKAIEYDATGDAHYDAASALIKSIRGSDPDAALYWLARMLEAGEDVRFLARRIVIAASEDIGNADPHALPLAVAAMQACEFVGLPECQLPLAQAVTYLACAPKSNAATVGIGEARARCQRRPAAAGAGASARPALPGRETAGAWRRVINMPTMRPAALRPRIIWESSGNTIGRSIAVSKKSWPRGWRRFGQAARGPLGCGQRRGLMQRMARRCCARRAPEAGGPRVFCQPLHASVAATHIDLAFFAGERLQACRADEDPPGASSGMASTLVQRTTPSTDLLTTIDAGADARWCCGQLEAGQILYLEQLPFSLPAEDRQFLLSQRQDARYHKNISYRPQEDKLRGFAADQPAEVERLHSILARLFAL